MNHSLQIGVREGVCCGVCGVVWGVCCDGVCWACVGFLGEKILLAPLYYPDTFASRSHFYSNFRFMTSDDLNDL